MDPRLIHHMGQVYYIAQNRGLFAIADQNTYKQLETLRQSRESVKTFLNQATAKEKRLLKIFVFGGDQYRYHRDTWLIGTTEMLFVLTAQLREIGAIVIDVGDEMYVPFSNSDCPKQEEIHLLRRPSDFREVFGIDPEELKVSFVREGGR